MAFLRRRSNRASAEAMRQHRADRELAEDYPRLRSGAEQGEQELRDAQAQGQPMIDIRNRNEALDQALGAALEAALAGERAAMGPKAYDDRNARRRAEVRDEVRRWAREVSWLRTVRERYRLAAMSRSGTLIPDTVQLRTHAMSSTGVPDAASGLPEQAAAQLDRPPVGVDLDQTVGEARLRSPGPGGPQQGNG